MLKLNRFAVSAVAGGLLVLGLGACSSSSDDSTAAAAPSAAGTPQPVVTLAGLSGVDTQVTLDQGFLDALTSLKLKAGVTGRATLTDGALHFPITGGNVTYYDPEQSYRPYVQGEIDHDGSGITLTGGKTVVGLSDFTIDPGTSRLTGTVKANGDVVGTDVFIFALNGNTLKPLSKDADGDAVLEGTQVFISPDAATLLNKTFGTDAVTSKLKVGVAKITAK